MKHENCGDDGVKIELSPEEFNHLNNHERFSRIRGSVQNHVWDGREHRITFSPEDAGNLNVVSGILHNAGYELLT